MTSSLTTSLSLGAKTVMIIAAALTFYLVSPLSEHVSWQAEAHAENPPGTPAKDTLETRDKDGNKVRCRDIPEAKGGTLIGYIVPCIIYSIQNTTQSFTEKMIEWLMPTVWAFITLVIVLFGVKLTQGEGEVHKQGFLLLVKIALVVGILQMIPGFVVPQLYGVMRESVMIVSETIDASSDLHCDASKFGDGETLPLWKNLDCVMGKMFGFATGSNGSPNMLLAASVLGLMGGFFFGGTFGVALFVILVGVLWSMFSMVIRTAFTFLNAYLYASLMLMISVLFLPLTLLKVTTTYFDRWWSSIGACILLPVIITAYVMFALLLYDKILFGPDADINKLFQYDKVKDAQLLQKQGGDCPIAANPDQRKLFSGLADNILYKNPFLKQVSAPITSASNNMCAAFKLPDFDPKRFDEGKFKTDKEAFTKWFMDAIKLLVTAILINLGFKSVLGFARMMIGSYSVGSMLDATTPQEQRFSEGLRQARQGLEQGLMKDVQDGKQVRKEDTTGKEFIERIPAGLKGAIQGFTTGISRATD